MMARFYAGSAPRVFMRDEEGAVPVWARRRAPSRVDGAAGGNRTHDLLFTKEVLYH